MIARHDDHLAALLAMTPAVAPNYDRDPGFIHWVGDELRRVLAAVR